jgi:glycogen(starch) synthase
MLSLLERYYGPLRKTVAIYNGRTGTGATAPKEPMIFAAGRLWDEAKEIRLLAEIAPQIEWPVCVAGDLRNPSDASVEWPGVRMLGWLDPAELAKWLARSAIYVLPARYEPFGLSVLEAALAGCALVLGDTPSLREIWGEAALYLPEHSGEALRDAIQTLINFPELREDRARQAHARALEFTPDAMALGYLAAYSEVMAEVNTREMAECVS